MYEVNFFFKNHIMIDINKINNLYLKSSNFNYILWNQGLVSLGFDDNKIRFKTNDYISSVIRQEDFQNDNHKDKSSQKEIMKKKTTSKTQAS